VKGRRHISHLIATALAAAVLGSACASTGTVSGGTPTPHPSPIPGGAAPPPPAPRTAPAPPASPALPAPPALPARLFDGYALVGTALALRGTPYRNGGTDPHGFDCSGFTQYVFAQYGVTLPRDVADQFKQGKSVKPEGIAAGDLIFFSTTGSGASHVAIAVGSDEFVHAPSSTGVVRVERMSSSYWAPRFLGVRRVG